MVFLWARRAPARHRSGASIRFGVRQFLLGRICCPRCATDDHACRRAVAGGDAAGAIAPNGPPSNLSQIRALQEAECLFRQLEPTVLGSHGRDSPG